MKILQFQADNVKRLKTVHIRPAPDGNMIVLGGDNAQGKTSVLDCIAMVLGGADRIPANPIHAGASKGQIILETEEFTATRTFSAKGGSSIVLKNKQGATLSSPQALLDSLTSRVSFDPLAFTRMKAVEQGETLRQLVGIDFADLKARYDEAYTERTNVNRDLKTQQARTADMKKHPFTPKTPVDSAALLAKIAAANATNALNARTRNEAVIAAQNDEAERVKLVAAKAAVTAAESALAAAQEALADAAESRQTMYKIANDLADTTEALVDVDTATITAELDQIEETNRKVRENAALAKDDGVTFNGVTFAEASAAEQLRISVAMGFAMQPKLKVALIRDGSLLDDKNLALIAEIAAEHDGQVWIERVGKGEECTVILEDGHVAEDRS